MKASSILAWSTAVFATLVGCGGEGASGDSSTSATGGASTAAGGTAETGGSGSVGTGGGSAQPGETDVDLTLPDSEETTPGDTELDEDSTCSTLSLAPDEVQTEQEVTTTVETEVPKPVALYIMLDNTLSMDQSGSSSTVSKWEEATSALSDFVNDPASAGMQVAIQYFHPVGVQGMIDECTGEGQAVAAVEMGALPDNADAITRSLDAAQTASSTPTTGALLGSIDYCAAYEAAHQDTDCVVIFVTDGLPHGCGLSAQCTNQTGGLPGQSNLLDCVDPNAQAELTPIAAAGLEAGVVSFMIGMAGVTEDGFDLLDALAIAAGSDCTPEAAGDEACDVSSSGAAGLLSALTAIRESVTVVETQTTTVVNTEIVTVPCEWTIPESPSGETLDPLKVNVDIIDTATGETTPMTYVTVETCDQATGPAWYYDNPDAPTTILVCPQTCTQIEEQTTWSVDVKFGCERRGLVT